eukprot:EG_transcript_52723
MKGSKSLFSGVVFAITMETVEGLCTPNALPRHGGGTGAGRRPHQLDPTLHRPPPGGQLPGSKVSKQCYIPSLWSCGKSSSSISSRLWHGFILAGVFSVLDPG